jgi:hypothetical protein
MRLYCQVYPEVWSASGGLASSGSITSGSFVTEGYSRILGIHIANATGTCIAVYQSGDHGAHFDYYSACTPTACAACAMSVEVVGNAAKIVYCNSSGSADIYRTQWRLRPV